ncbi:hypothetical protein [Psychrobacter urativorans]|uniref:Uncharacterized protein n=1 Tax=Psychrobacter urativorans TaxID=45610 RepID=A0A0M5MPZ8_9GAMM|nr:hypothetical protein [Psychrobacter urativorans]ALF59875.1 hypothetical protein AOC03_07330 [Psychrobacter urativorans]
MSMKLYSIKNKALVPNGAYFQMPLTKTAGDIYPLLVLITSEQTAANTPFLRLTSSMRQAYYSASLV